jgi:hypothetical protein
MFSVDLQESRNLHWASNISRADDATPHFKRPRRSAAGFHCADPWRTAIWRARSLLSSCSSRRKCTVVRSRCREAAVVNISAPLQRAGNVRLNICLRPRPRHWNWYELWCSPTSNNWKGLLGVAIQIPIKFIVWGWLLVAVVVINQFFLFIGTTFSAVVYNI